jgi:predicted permease
LQLSEERSRRTTILVYPAHTLFPGFFSVARSFAALLMAVVILVLLVACSNIAILLLAQTVARRREVGIRLALGATRWQVIRLFLAESLLISIAGGLSSVALAVTTARFLSQIYLPTPMPIALTFHFDWRVGVFGAALCIAATLLCGLGPAIQSAKEDIRTSIQQVSLAAGPRGVRTRNGLVIAQFAMSTLLLATAAAALQSTTPPSTSDLGFSTRNVLMATLNFNSAGYTPARAARFQEQFLANAERKTGILSVALVDIVPLSQTMLSVEVSTDAGQTSRSQSKLRVSTNRISGQFFRTLEIPLLAGRVFDSRDTIQSARVCIVNEALAQQLWPGQNPVGKRLFEPSGSSMEIVGLARDSKYESLGEQSKPFLYRPAAQQVISTGTFLLRADGSPAAAIATVRELVAELDPDLLVYNLSPLEERIGLNLLPNRVLAWVAISLGIVALVLGAVGTFGLFSFLVNQRRHEMGVRMALGAQRSDVLQLILGYGLRMAGTGALIGSLASLVATRLLAGYLHGIPERDPLQIGGVVLILCGTALMACLVPALRACKADPLQAIRYE